jgi:hypothetical protein
MPGVIWLHQPLHLIGAAKPALAGELNHETLLQLAPVMLPACRELALLQI